MPFHSIIWDLDDDPDGNVRQCAEHGVAKEEVEEAIATQLITILADRQAAPCYSVRPKAADI